ncbi:MAG: hypothetical protein KF725_00090 [Cyclobacteriaceae bacterium]|nr:hypothetical protein [Cyclobacteriaceae bacterium]UYN87132.1 MAG: hypothetical protein KIT51_02315 [Cyclobacteriaceae bacterium]
MISIYFKIAFLSIVYFLNTPSGYAQKQKQKVAKVQIQESAKLTRLKTESSQSEYAHYNPENNKLLYYGLLADNDNRVIGSVIAVRNLNDSTEQILDRNVGYPHLGWVDTSHVLIYRTFPERSRPKNFFSQDYKRAVYIYDLNTGMADTIDNLPLRIINNRIKVDFPYLVYQTGTVKNPRLYKYDLRNRQTVALLRDSAQFGFDDMQFAFRVSDDRLIYCESQKLYINLMKCISSGLETTLFDAIQGSVDITFDKFANRFYFLHYKSLPPGPDEIVGSGYQELKSYNFDTKEVKLHYVFKKHSMITGISPYEKNTVIVSLSTLTDKPTTQSMSVGEVPMRVSTAYESHIYILKFDD